MLLMLLCVRYTTGCPAPYRQHCHLVVTAPKDDYSIFTAVFTTRQAYRILYSCFKKIVQSDTFYYRISITFLWTMQFVLIQIQQSLSQKAVNEESVLLPLWCFAFRLWPTLRALKTLAPTIHKLPRAKTRPMILAFTNYSDTGFHKLFPPPIGLALFLISSILPFCPEKVIMRYNRTETQKLPIHQWNLRSLWQCSVLDHVSVS